MELGVKWIGESGQKSLLYNLDITLAEGSVSELYQGDRG
jgi:hypothetical protein